MAGGARPCSRPRGGAALACSTSAPASGAIALALAHERPGRRDRRHRRLASEALKIAQQNAEELGMAERIRFLAGDGFDAGRRACASTRWSRTRPTSPGAATRSCRRSSRHEPELALFAGDDGTRAAARGSRRRRRAGWLPGGALALEHAPDQAEAVARACQAAGLVEVGLRRDLSGKPRVTTARRAPGARGRAIAEARRGG